MKSLSQRLDDYAEAWRPQPGDKLIGIVVAVDQRTSLFNDTPYALVTVETEDGSTENGQPIQQGAERAWHAFHTVARNELRKLKPKVGERLGVAYHGKGAKPYERYRVVVDRRRPQIDWDELAGTDVPAAEDVHDETGRSVGDESAEAGEDDELPF